MRSAMRRRARVPALAVAAIIASLAAFQAIGPASTYGSGAQSTLAAAGITLPPGAARETLAVSCQTCHSLQMVLQQRLPEKAWRNEITKMVHWGAVVTASKQASLAAYLARNLGPTVPVQPASLVRAPSAAAANVTLPGLRTAFMAVDAHAHRVDLTLIAAYTGALGGFNFNGDGNGRMVITVPAGWTVAVAFSNRSAVPHSALFTPYAQRQRASSFVLAFPGAASADPAAGIAAGRVQRFRFVARAAGRYALVCAVPGHEEAGMWDTLLVTAGGAPRLTL